MLLSAVSVLVVAQSSSEIPEGLMNNPVYIYVYMVYFHTKFHIPSCNVSLITTIKQKKQEIFAPVEFFCIKNNTLAMTNACSVTINVNIFVNCIHKNTEARLLLAKDQD